MNYDDVEKMISERIRTYLRNQYFAGKLIFELHIKEMRIEQLLFQPLPEKENCRAREIKTITNSKDIP
jgi:hypothetical protein